MASDKKGTVTESAEMDWDAIVKASKREAAKKAAALAARRVELRNLLVECGAKRVEAGYDGYGDSGNVNGVVVTPVDIKPGDLMERLSDFIWDVAYNLHPGFEIDDGGEGALEWDLAADRIDVKHTGFFTCSEDTLHEDVRHGAS